MQNIDIQLIVQTASVKLMWEKGAIGKQAQMKSIQDKLPPIKLQLDPTAAIAKLEEFISLIKTNSPQNIALTASGATAGKAGTAPMGAGVGTRGKQTSGARHSTPIANISRHQKRANTLRAQLRNTVLPWVSNESQLNTVLQNRKYFREAIKLTGINPMSANTTMAQMRQYLFGVKDLMMANNVAVPWQIENQIQKLTSLQAKNAEAQAKTAAIQKKESVNRSIARHQQVADRLRVRAQNAMLPFAQTKEQLNLLTKYRKFFRQGLASTGFSAHNMQPQQMLPYLQAVSNHMQAANVAVPWQLQSQINKLQSAQAAAKSSSGSSRTAVAPIPAQKPFFDRARKFAYPFTGPTSFGTRTPMAVDMAKGMGVMFAIGGAMSAIGNSFGQAMEYQNTMRTTKAILQNGTNTYTESGFKNMEHTVREVGVKTKFSAPQVADAARFLAMAGYDIQGINAAIRPIADLALIGDTDLGETADKMTNILTTFGITADKIESNPEIIRQYANILTTTATRSNTDLMMLAESFKYGGGVANMYGRKDPNLFADTAAIFGVMGNAGIQASSAGTALRMMYQNIFNPNKKQKAILDLISGFGVKVEGENGEKRSMADILIDMANNIPEDKMAEIVGKLFRITAQPGANAALLSATDIALEGAGGDTNAAGNIINDTNAFVDKFASGNVKKKMGALSALIQANRNSVNSNISGAVAEEKQNTISGLWAQVTSTFTEGIVQAFEQRQGGFEGMLKGLRDYLAKPETMIMLQNLLDMVIEIGKVLAQVIKMWANIYNSAPDLIKFWVKCQLLFTQIGTFITPVVALIGVFNRLGRAISWLTGVSMTGIGSIGGRAVVGRAAVSTTAANAAMYAPLLVGNVKGKAVKIGGNFAVRTRKQLADNALLATALATTPVGVAQAKSHLDHQTNRRATLVKLRAQNIYGTKPRIDRAFIRGFNATISTAAFAYIFGGIKQLFTGLIVGLSKAIGLLINPISIVIGSMAAMGWMLYKLKQRIDGTTEAQRASFKAAKKTIDETSVNLNNNAEWHNDILREGMPEPIRAISSSKPEKIREFEARRAQFKENFKILFTDFHKNASNQSVNLVANEWREIINRNPNYRLALGQQLGEYTDDLTKFTKDKIVAPYQNNSGTATAALSIASAWSEDERHAVELRNKMMRSALMMEGANDPEVQKGVKQIVELQKLVLSGENNPQTHKPYDKSYFESEAAKIRANIVNKFPTAISSNSLTVERYQQTDDRRVYDLYQNGALNLIDAYIEGLTGTKTKMLESQEELQNKVNLFQETWYQAVAAIANGYTIVDEFVSADGKQRADVNMMLNVLPNGMIDFGSLEHQIAEKIGAFKLNLQKFTDIAATFYKSLGTVLTQDELYELLYQQVEHKHVDEKTARKYYMEHIANNTNNRWYKQGITEQQYVDFVTSTDESKTITFADGSKTIPARERATMRSTIARDSTKAAMNAFEGEQNTSTTNTSKTSSSSQPQIKGPSQDVYASHYGKSAARPTVVNINIGELAHFDRTAIASSAQERDIMAAVEDKMAESIYRFWVATSNSMINNWG